MVSYVMESRKGGRSLVALLVALAVATVGIYIATTATMAKPAHAIGCYAYAERPQQTQSSMNIYHSGGVQCSGTIRSSGATLVLQRQNLNGGWSNVSSYIARPYDSDTGSDHYTDGTVWVQKLYLCSWPWDTATYRTQIKDAYTIALNGHKEYYNAVYSTKVPLAC
jgi:hypothetical protein